MRRHLAILLALANTLPGCASMRAAMRGEAVVTASRDLACGTPKVEALEDWSFRAESACGEVRFYRCGLDQHMSHPMRPEPHFDCHAHATEADVVGFFHPADEPGHRW